MPKIILDSKKAGAAVNNICAKQPSQSELNATEKLKLDRMLRKPRSKGYLQAMSRLDAGGHVHNEDETNVIIDAIREEFPEIVIDGILLGIVSKCFLGAPYEVHTLTMNDQIVEHYKRGQALPDGLEKARSLAMNDHYEFIEVYDHCCRAVSSDGMVSVVIG